MGVAVRTFVVHDGPTRLPFAAMGDVLGPITASHPRRRRKAVAGRRGFVSGCRPAPPAAPRSWVTPSGGEGVKPEGQASGRTSPARRGDGGRDHRVPDWPTCRPWRPVGAGARGHLAPALRLGPVEPVARRGSFERSPSCGGTPGRDRVPSRRLVPPDPPRWVWKSRQLVEFLAGGMLSVLAAVFLYGALAGGSPLRWCRQRGHFGRGGDQSAGLGIPAPSGARRGGPLDTRHPQRWTAAARASARLLRRRRRRPRRGHGLVPALG